MKIDGRCHCGYITYEAEIDPDKTLICHCTDCQTLSGSAFRVVAYTREDAFKLLSGELKIYVKTSESGNKRRQSFCPECGTPQDPKSIPFDWAPLVNAIRSRPMCKYGLAPRSHGSTIPGQSDGSKSSRRSITAAT
jgi:Glutathione-dependent formaldehyde-activating enzyme